MNRARPMAARLINHGWIMNRARPMAARLKNKNKSRVNLEPRSAHGRAVNKGMKRTNSLPLSPVVLTRPYCRENRYLQVLRSTVRTAKLEPRLFRALKIFFCYMYKLWRERQLLAQAFWMQSEYSLESLNFAAFTKPNKHKTDSKDFSTTRPNLFSNTFTTVGEFKRLLQSFFSNGFSRHDGTVLPVPVTSTSARSCSLPSPSRAFRHDKSLQNPSPAVNFKRRISLKRFRYLLAAFHFRAEIGRLRARKKNCEPAVF